ncbi:MAG: alpha/beta fold hydrolase [Elusimicrobiota bacterium]|nr:alpha/beta fold hydrolase [Elusimicrobiota bacterium]
MNAWKAAYPFTGRRIDLGGYAMHYLDEGKGETVVFVHGNPTWSFYFREAIKHLRSSHRCLAPDHVGMGLSDRPGDRAYRYTLESRIADLETLITRVAPTGPVSLVLHDWGGMIGMGWAVRHPERVARVAAFNTSCFRLPPGKRFPAGLAFLRGPLGALAIRGLGAGRRAVLRTCTARRVLAPEVAAGYLEPLDGWREARAAHRFVQDIPLSPRDRSWAVVADIEARLGALKDKPVLLPWGLKDWVFDEDFLAGWVERFPKAVVKRFPDCGHLLLEDAPERVVPLLADFLAGKTVAA